MCFNMQKEIIELPGNVIVQASAGTGKTYTMVSKIEYDVKHCHTHKVVAAITFTIKAAKEIKEKLKIDITNHFVGTNNSFAVEEIIKPFLKDVFGKIYNQDLSTDYSIKVNSFEEGLEKIKESQILCAFENNKENFIFQLALCILKESKACQLYLKAKYFKIYIDEYQDCDKDMHALFMYICKILKIDTFVVGDAKQSIYVWRGAYPEAFERIKQDKEFTQRELKNNFRSCQQIQNYSNLLFDDTKVLYKSVYDLSSIIVMCTTTENWVSSIKPYLDLNKKCALLRHRNKNVEDSAKDLNDNDLDFTYIPTPPIANITTAASWIYKGIAKYFIIPRYSIYDFKDEIPNGSFENKRILPQLKSKFGVLEKCIEQKAEFEHQVELMATYLGYDVKKDHCQKLYETICNKKFFPAFNVEEQRRIAMTIHSSKGLEFDQVIVFASDYKLSKDEDFYNHYVAVTRAKSKLIIVYIDNDNYAKQFAHHIKKKLAESNLEMRDVATVVNNIKRSHH